MADLFHSPQETSNLRKILLTGVIVALVLAGAFGIFYHHENHAPLEATASRRQRLL